MAASNTVTLCLAIGQDTLDFLYPHMAFVGASLGHTFSWPGAESDDTADFRLLAPDALAGQSVDFVLCDSIARPDLLEEGQLGVFLLDEDGEMSLVGDPVGRESGGRQQALECLIPLRKLWGERREMPWLSIFITSYNYGRYIGQSIDSVLAQYDDGIELLVLDNASTDDTATVLARYQDDPRVRILVNETNLGAHINGLNGFRLCRGRYVNPLCADDYYLPGHLDRVRALLADAPQTDVIFTRLTYVDSDDQRIALPAHPGYPDHDGLTKRNELLTLLVRDNYAPPSSTLSRREMIERVGLDLGFHGAGDWALAVDIAKAGGHFAFLSESGVAYRFHPAQHTQQWGSGLEPAEDHIRLLERVLTGGVPDVLRGVERPVAAYLQARLGMVKEALSSELRERANAVFTAFGQEQMRLAEPKTGSVEPMFSIILTTYNRPRLLLDALSSIRAQSYTDWEVILVNDGGDLQESIIDWVERDARITYLRKPNGGLAAARNTGLRLARGRYIAYLDDDDVWSSHHLAMLAGAFERYPDKVVYTDSELVLEDISGGLRKEQGRARPYAHDDYDHDRLQIANFIPVNTWSHARYWLDKVGNFDESFSALEDWDMLIRLSRVTDFHHVRDVTAEVRQRKASGDNMTGRESSRMKSLYQRIYEKYDDENSPAIRAGRAAVMAVDHPAKASLFVVEYQRWHNQHAMREVDADILAERMVLRWKSQPLMTLVMKVTRADLDDLAVSIQSLQNQLYQHWRLIIVADFPAPDPVFLTTNVLGWLEVDSLDDPARFAEACTIIVNDVSGDWLGIFLPGSEFRADWLLRCADHAQTAGALQVAFYSDHDIVLMPGSYVDPQFKPDFNLEYLTSWDYVGKACWFRQGSVTDIGGVEPYPDAEGFDLLLRLADHFGEEAIGHLSDPHLHIPRRPAGPLEAASRRVAIENHLARLGRRGEVLDGAIEETFKIVYPLEGTPRVSIIIPNRDKLEFLQPCIDTLFAKTRYDNFEVVIVDNQSRDPDTLEYYALVTRERAGRVRVVNYEQEFNFSAQCNLGVQSASGDYILLLNNDIELIQPEWLERMLMQAQRPEVGIVGAKLVYPETGKIQHAGILLGGGGELQSIASHIGDGDALDDAGYMNRLRCEMYLSAVTAACLLVRREIYQQLGGFDENLGVLYNDVDFCLRVGEAGYKILWTPYAILVHHHGKSVNGQLKDPQSFARMAERNRLETTRMLERWLPKLGHDPAYNRGMSLTQKPLSMEMRVPCSMEPEFNERVRIMASAINGGSGEYRVIQPLEALSMQGKAQTLALRQNNGMTRLVKLAEVERLNPDVIVVQNALNDVELEMLRLYQAYFPTRFKVMTLDDLVTRLPEKSSLYRNFMANFRDARRRVREALAYVDRVIVSTEPLAEFARQFTSDVVVVPNRLKRSAWGNLTSLRNVGKKPRVGWVGALQHQGDLEILHKVIEATAAEVDWVFMGMWPENMDHLIHEKVPPVPFAVYPQKVASLNLDLAVAPLELNPFNEAKSNLRLLEYGAMGWPVICTDIYPYQTNDAPVTRVENTPEAWIAAILERVHDRKRLAREGDELKAWVERHYFLEDHLEEWMAAYSR